MRRRHLRSRAGPPLTLVVGGSWSLRRATDEVIVVADEVAEEAEHRAQFDTYQVDGTPGYRPNRLEMISAPINFARSCDVAGLQAADLAAYLHRRRERTSPTHPRAVKTLRSLSAELDAQTVHCHTWVP